MPQVQKDYYKILGVAPVASAEDIRKAYRLLSKKYHPDLNPDLHMVNEGDEKMQELVTAYNVLNDGEKRKAYDAQPFFQLRRKKSAIEHKRISVEAAHRVQFARPEKPPSFFERLGFGGKKAPAARQPEAQAMDPKQSDTHVTLGLSMVNDPTLYDQARNEFRLAVRFDPSNKEAQYNLGVMCYRLGDFAEAFGQFQRVLAIDRKDENAQIMLALLQDDEI